MIKNYFNLLRVPQWIKNFFVFAPLVFSKHLFDIHYVIPSLQGFIIFCLVSSIVYILNDIIDIEADRAHPKKKFRPIPSGAVSKATAIILGVILFVIMIASLYFIGNSNYTIVVLSYFILNAFYSMSFKHIVLLDIFSIAAGFMLRVISGAVIISVPISSWLILTTMFLSLYLGVMKRYSELEIVPNGGSVTSTRKVLTHYSPVFTQQMATIAAAGVIICYALYTVTPRTVTEFGTDNLIYTTPFVVFGIFRYMYLTYINQKGENTTEIMLTDAAMISNVFLYIIITTLIIYKIII
ncbi:MAG TPA: decaprenyl-phosphate phosphoribosyltransferase [Ignavibacteriaceae bacterium]|nr:decaprenyl-phosphate phosphoribosyltransferase [Ignavibacteriaceae bacterium]